jgi:hypothetical protein
LHAFERLPVLANVLENDKRCQHGGDDGADGLERLGKLETKLRVLRRTADWDSLAAFNQLSPETDKGTP